jgi:hypothetical protein
LHSIVVMINPFCSFAARAPVAARVARFDGTA